MSDSATRADPRNIRSLTYRRLGNCHILWLL